MEEAKSSLRKSQILLDEVNYDVKSLPRMENLSGSSGDDLPELSTKKYPYLSNTTYSLPRNHRCEIGQSFLNIFCILGCPRYHLN